GDFSTKSLRDFALRAPLEMTYRGNVLKSRTIFCFTDRLPPDVISTKWSEAERVEKSPRR
ncbi:MAG: hypothetical protein UIH27_16170, partial [Ruminococcus sp.]|nr:hypothetical protein [Ruminococcus sp.]